MIRVTLIRRSGRRFFEARWKDPVTGRKRTRGTGESNRRDAERFAARLEDELNAGNSRDVQRITWAAATQLFAAEIFPSQAIKTAQKMRDCWRLVQSVVDPHSPASIRETEISRLVIHLQNLKRSPFTIKSHLSKLHVFLDWCRSHRFVQSVPVMQCKLRMVEPNRGRPITREEFSRMLKAVRKVTGKPHAPQWRRLLIGLWLSGLRLNEACELRWSGTEGLVVDLSGKRPMFRIEARDDKARKYRLLPMTPDFYRFLCKTPEADRHGYVFWPIGIKGQRLKSGEISKVICDVGKKALVKVSETAKRVKYASAHDLRRAYGFRWSNRVRAPILMALMRHASITTTMQFYVRQDAEAAANEVWRGIGNTFGNSRHSSDPAGDQENTQSSGKRPKS